MNFARLWLFVLVFGIAFSGCPCTNSAINANEGMRWWLFSNFGASKVCPEMLKKGVPLKLALLGPNSVGRFFPLQCATHVDDNTHTMRVDVTGQGYVNLPFTKRVGFYAGVAVEFKPDFRLEDDAMYVWGRFQRVLQAPDLRLLGVENSLIQLATQTPAGSLATLLGNVVLQSELSRGFTVVRGEDGDDFTLGILQPPNRPKRFFASQNDRLVLAQDVTDIHAASREYIGPIEVAQNNAAIYARIRSAGAVVDYALVPKSLGDAWMQPYLAAQPIGPPPAAPIAYGQAGGDHARTLPVAPGFYYLVVENRSPAPAAILGMPLPFETIANVTYSVEVGQK